MELQCPECKALNPADSAFCGICGAVLAPEDAVPEATPPPGQVPDDAEEEMGATGPEAPAEPAPPPPLPPDDVEEEIDAAGPEAPGEPEPPPPLPPDDVEEETGAAGPEAIGEPEPPPPLPPDGVEEEIDAAGPESPAEPAPPPPLPPDDEEEVVMAVSEPAEIEEAAPPPAARTYYSEDDVVVTGQAVVLGDKIYALDSITSVSMETKPPNRIPSILLALLGGLMAVAALTDIFRDPILGILLTTGGLVLLGIGVLLAATDKASYIVRLGTPSEKVDALALPDRDRAAQIVDAINRALVDRA